MNAFYPSASQQKWQKTDFEQGNSYVAYGLKIKSQIPLPELQSANAGQDQVFIELDNFSLPTLKPTSIYRQGIEAQFNITGKIAFLHWHGIASFKIEDGNKLSVMKARDNLEASLLNLYLLSEALGVILYQRGYFLLHGSSVVVDDQALVFLGVPGAGKSTMAGAFAQKGYSITADDMVALEVGEQISVIPAFPQLKLWENSVQGLNYDRQLTIPLFKGSGKRVIRDLKNFFPLATKKIPLKAIYLLQESNSSCWQIDKLTPQKKIINLTRFFSCPHQLLSGKSLTFHFQQCQIIAQQIPIYELNLPKKFTIFDSVIAELTN